MVLYVVQTNPLKRIAVGPDYKYPLRQSIHLFMFYTLHCVYSYSSLATVNVAVTLDKNMSVPSASPFIIISAPYATSVPLYLKTWPKWLRVLSLAAAVPPRLR